MRLKGLSFHDFSIMTSFWEFFVLFLRVINSVRYRYCTNVRTVDTQYCILLKNIIMTAF